MTRRVGLTAPLLVMVVVLVLGGCTPTRDSALQRGAAWLWSQQASDGGWHSKTYGLLRSGQSLTPFVLGALIEVPEDVYAAPRDKVDAALGFLRSETQPNGALGMADRDIPDYPNYATALAVSAICKLRREGWHAQAAPMVRYLRDQQFTGQNGWHPPDAVYGGWGMGGDRRTPPATGHVDLSMTRHVLEALRASGAADNDPAFISARIFVERCQNFGSEHDADGGFFFSTTEADTNKAGTEGERFRSYGSTTADGFLALRAIGRPLTDPRVQAATEWFRRHGLKDGGTAVPGFVGEAYRRWPFGLMFYYAGTSARVFHEIGQTNGGMVRTELIRNQRGDGSWANAENLVKEDDPLIATPFAVRALVSARER